MRLIAVVLLALGGLLGLAPAAHANVEPGQYEASVLDGCGTTTLNLFNGSAAEADFVVTSSDGEAVVHRVAAGQTVQLDLADDGPLPTIAVDGQSLAPMEMVPECGGVATIDARACDGEVDVTMNAVARPLEYQVWVDGTLAETYPVDGAERLEVVAADPGEQVEVWDESNRLASLEVPACEQAPPPVTEPPVVPPAAAPVPSPEVAVLGTKFSAPAAAPTPAPQTAVLGTKSAAPQLAMTGPEENTALVGALLLLVGAALVSFARRSRTQSP
ncbi:MAG TPA: hypothetical protein VFD41_11680 [Actinomycetales bacterium]|nr:hypothetical protein [Actinomycetales bacterium]